MTTKEEKFLNKASKEYIKKQELEICKRTDRSFRVLLIIEWFFGIIAALYISPKTWSGGNSETHLHLWTAILLGGVIVSLPILLVFTSPGTKLSRYVIAISQTLYGSMLIHLMGGRIEAHFHIFGSLAFLSTYRQWKVLIPATLIIAIDHIIRGIYWPQSVYGVISASEWRWLEHAAWVIFEDVFLIISIVQGKKDMTKIAETRAKLQYSHNQIEKRVKEKTEQLNREQALSFNAAKLASLGEMAGGIAHEVNTPLGAILLTSQVLKSQIESENFDKKGAVKLTESIEKTTNKISKIIHALRSFSRGGNNDPFLDTLINEIIDYSITLSSEKLKLKSIEMRFNPEKSKNISIQCKESQIGQVLLNLLNNSSHAIEALDERWISIDLNENEKEIIILFKDSGTGIPKKIQEKLFQPFFTTKEIGVGTGLGMSISKGIIESHDGTIELLPEEKNTTFKISLPKVQKNSDFNPFE
tara:strand:+ start:1942 stop:3357 length:1416 start_codon:yes stop_codon:yes gene_type:complete